MYYVVQVKTGKELEVLNALSERNIKAIVPLGCRYKRVKGAWKLEKIPIFKGYVFIDVDYNAKVYYQIMEVDSVIRLLRADKPLRLSYNEAEWIRLLDEGASFPTRIRLKEDGSYEVVGGVLASFTKQVVKIDKHKRCAVLSITLLNQTYEVVMAIDVETK